MKKSLIALAVAGAFVAPAFADTANVNVGGQMHLSLDYLDADTAAASGNWNVSSNVSNIYFKGTEDLGGGMKAVWQVQTYFDAGATGNADGSFGGTANGVGSGNTYVGLNGGFGTVLLGKHEAPLKIVSRKVDLFNNQIGDSRNLTAGAANDIRPNNVLAYATPNMNGFEATIAYVTNTAAGAATDASDTAVSMNAFYTNGPLLLGAGYQNRDFGAAALSDETVWRLAAGYSFGDFKVVAFWQDESDVAGAANADRNVWGLGGAYKMGPMTLKAQYYNRDDLGAAKNTGSDLWAVGLDYAMSKRTTAYVAYASTDNESAATATAFGGGHGDNPATKLGGNPNGFSVGMIHNF